MVNGRKARSNRGRKARTEAERRAIARINKRLRTWLADHRDLRTEYAISKYLGVGVSVVQGWFISPPQAIDVLRLAEICEREGLNANWLLFGKGPELRDALQPVAKTTAALRAQVLAEVKAAIGQKYATVLDRLLPSGDELLRNMVEDQRVRIGRAIEDERRAARTRMVDELAVEKKLTPYERALMQAMMTVEMKPEDGPTPPTGMTLYEAALLEDPTPVAREDVPPQVLDRIDQMLRGEEESDPSSASEDDPS